SPSSRSTTVSHWQQMLYFSKFANDWLFRLATALWCASAAELGVANKLDGAPSISKKRSPEPSFGPLPREDRGEAMPAGIQRAVRRRIALFLVTQQLLTSTSTSNSTSTSTSTSSSTSDFYTQQLLTFAQP
ncbi:hypothetical protein, partial [Bosea sp. (in: a-proteobacteria)]|uniref:hypothetical protein n=1 Tax=Bosea sp. (in: a-proteobacteria) TaxID=1871050 RepID=UPI0040339C34